VLLVLIVVDGRSVLLPRRTSCPARRRWSGCHGRCEMWPSLLLCGGSRWKEVVLNDVGTTAARDSRVDPA
jgi:hypothetical protein